jgi:hypothetical protein
MRIVAPELMVPAVKAEMYSPNAGLIDVVKSFALFPVLK